MPFVPLSADGVQRATTEALGAPRAQVALEPHENGVTVLAFEPDGLRPIGQLDMVAAQPYRRVLLPLAERGVYGTCLAEATVNGTLLHLGPARTCVPPGAAAEPTAEDPADAPPVSTRSGRLREEDDEDQEPGTLPLPGPSRTALAAAAARVEPLAAPPSPPGPRHLRRHRPRRHRARRGLPGLSAAPARLVLAALTGLLLVGAIAQGLTGADPAEDDARTVAGAAPVGVPSWTPPPPTAPAVVVVAPSEVAQVAPPEPAEAPRRPAPPARPADDEPSGGSEHGSDEHSSDEHESDSDHDESHEDSGEDRSGDGSDDGHHDSDDSGGSGGSDDDDRPSLRTCWKVWSEGDGPIRRGEPGYSRELDLDGDGKACERR